MPRPLLIVLAALAALVAAAPAAAEDPPSFRPGEVVVRTAEGSRVVPTREGETVREAARRWRARPGVRSSGPNYLARITGFTPNDPGRRRTPGGWLGTQWNFSSDAGVSAQPAWDHLIAAGRPGGRGVLVAVLDTGVAYSDRGRFARSPDLLRRTFERGYDFVDGDRYPNDDNGHGTHVASTIAEAANNGIGVTGLAYGAHIIPLRVLDRKGFGDSIAIAKAIRFATRRGADIINLSFEFGTRVTPGEIPDIISALRFADRRGVLVVGASGNERKDTLAYPARAASVMSVGAVTEHGCVARYSNSGQSLDISAPGGGEDARIPDDPNCRPFEEEGRDIVQMTFTRRLTRFRLPNGYVGTSMAAPHVSATAALVIASGLLGPDPTPDAIEARLKQTARDLGAPGPDSRYGAGMVDAGRATDPLVPVG